MKYRKFFISFLIFSLIMAVLVWLIIRVFSLTNMAPGFWANYALFFSLTLLSTLLLLAFVSVNARRFQTMVLLSVFIKLVIAAIYFSMVYKNFSSDLLIFVSSFFISYLLFTIFEVSFLVRLLKKNEEIG